MSEIILFHHVLGLTDGVRTVAQRLRDAGHAVRTPDLFGGRTFSDIPAGLAHASELGDDELLRRAEAALADAPADVILGGFSLGVMLAQQLLQTRPGVRGALLFHSFVEPTMLPGAWPDGAPVHVLAMQDDPFLVEDGDLAAARAWQADHPELVLHLYPGRGHLFLEPASPDHDAVIAERAIADAVEAVDAMGASAS